MPETIESQPGVVRVSVSLFPEQDEIVRKFSDESMQTYSGALRFIIRDWARQKRVDISAATPEPAR